MLLLSIGARGFGVLLSGVDREQHEEVSGSVGGTRENMNSLMSVIQTGRGGAVCVRECVAAARRPASGAPAAADTHSTVQLVSGCVASPLRGPEADRRLSHSLCPEPEPHRPEADPHLNRERTWH